MKNIYLVNALKNRKNECVNTLINILTEDYKFKIENCADAVFIVGNKKHFSVKAFKAMNSAINKLDNKIPFNEIPFTAEELTQIAKAAIENDVRATHSDSNLIIDRFIMELTKDREQ